MNTVPMRRLTKSAPVMQTSSSKRPTKPMRFERLSDFYFKPWGNTERMQAENDNGHSHGRIGNTDLVFSPCQTHIYLLQSYGGAVKDSYM